jgi:uncharacterized membrane protein YbhN (UPF0104 family)
LVNPTRTLTDPAVPALHAASPPAEAPPPGRWKRRVRTTLSAAFLLLVAALLVHQARAVNWHEVLASMRSLPFAALALAAMLAAASHTLYSSFDLLGRHLTGHPLSTRQVTTVTFVSYAFNLNLGSLVGGLALRFRLYSRLGLDNPTIFQVVSLSMMTNWLGYLLLAGLLFAFGPLQPPPEWRLDAQALHTLGLVLLGLCAAWMLLCTFSPRREWTVRGHPLKLPTARLSLLQLGMSMANWALMGGVVFVLLQQRIDYPSVLAVLLVAAVAGVIAHVPAGLGVLEAVFVALLSHRMDPDELLAALVTYRGLYYLLPLIVATVVYAVIEARARRDRRARAR